MKHKLIQTIGNNASGTYNEYFLWGNTGQAIVLNDFLPELGMIHLGTFDNNSKIKSLGGWKEFLKWSKKNKNKLFAVAIGGDRGKIRFELQEQIKILGHKPLTAIHPKALIAGKVMLGDGCQIMMGAKICTYTEIGEATIINTGAQVDHEGRIGKGVHLMPGSILAGCVKIGDFATIGSGAIIFPRVTIGEGAIIGAGSVVTQDVPAYEVWHNAMPAKFIRKT